jgi:hypothetical protein
VTPLSLAFDPYGQPIQFSGRKPLVLGAYVLNKDGKRQFHRSILKPAAPRSLLRVHPELPGCGEQDAALKKMARRPCGCQRLDERSFVLRYLNDDRTFLY